MIRDELLVLRSLEGAAYRARRDALITTESQLETELATFVDSPMWSQSVTARILIGRARHAELHARIEQAIQNADVEGARKTAGGFGSLLNEFAESARVDWGEGALSLSWETLLKEGDEKSAVTLAFHLAILRGLPHPLSVEVILAFMQGRDDQGMIEMAARTLSAFPPVMIEAKVAIAYRRHDLIAGALQRLRVDIYVNSKEGA